MMSVSYDTQTDIVEVFNSASKYLDDLLNVANPDFKGMVPQTYTNELQLKKGNSADTEAAF